MNIVYDRSRMRFAVHLQAGDGAPPQVVPIRALEFSQPSVLRVRDGLQAEPLTEDHLPVFGLPVSTASFRRAAYMQDIFVDAGAGRAAAFELSAVPRAQAREHAHRVPGHEVERLAGELMITPAVQHQLVTALHTPVDLARTVSKDRVERRPA